MNSFFNIEISSDCSFSCFDCFRINFSSDLFSSTVASKRSCFDSHSFCCKLPHINTLIPTKILEMNKNLTMTCHLCNGNTLSMFMNASESATLSSESRS